MTLSAPAKPTFLNADETSITFEFAADTNAANYKLYWKEYPKVWEDAAVKSIASGPGNIKAVATDLLPATTYTVRIAPIDAQGKEGPASPEMTVDTEAVSCTPQSKSCCVIL